MSEYIKLTKMPARYNYDTLYLEWATDVKSIIRYGFFTVSLTENVPKFVINS